MLTWVETEDIKNRLRRGDRVFSIATDLDHSPHTIRKVRDRLREEEAKAEELKVRAESEVQIIISRLAEQMKRTAWEHGALYVDPFTGAVEF